MIVKALLAFAGLRAAPHFHNARVHDARNSDAALVSGVRCLAREAVAVSHAIATDPEDAARIEGGADRARSLAAAIQSRAARTDRALEEVLGIQRGDDVA